jgi:hypothetical protein
MALRTMLAASTSAGRKALRHYRRHYGRYPNLSKPKLFSEFVQLYKIGYRNPKIIALSDKAAVKAVVAATLGQEWVTPSLFEGEWLPDRRDWPLPYVIKANNGSGANVFVHGRHDEDWPRVDDMLRRWLDRPHGQDLGEWVYAQITPRLLVEPFVDDLSRLIDYKVFVFGGRAEFVQTHTDRFGDHRSNFYTRTWQPLNWSLNWPLDPIARSAPASLGAMLEAAETLGASFPFVRVYFYEIDGRPRFGEATFYPESGYCDFDPAEVDAALGALCPPASQWRM